jgi:hypothetical protein
MPLVEGAKAKTEEGIAENIRISLAEGKPHEQAVAIAMRQAGKPKPKENKYRADFKGIKLFGVGEFKPVNGKQVKITPKHLEDMVAFYEQLKDKALPDVIITHADNKSVRDKEYPSLAKLPFSVGKITSLRTDGEYLYGDYVNVIEPIKNALNDKMLTSHSAEIYEDVKLDGKDYKAILTGVALLPAGKFPALFKVFEPYMYQMDLGITNQQIDLQEITYKSKCLFSFSQEDKFEMADKKKCMSETEYMGAVKQYMADGMKVKEYSEFMEMDEDKQQEYMADLKKEYMSMKEKKKYEMQIAEERMKKETEGLVAELKEQLKEAKEMKQQYFSLISEIKETNSEEVSALKNQVERLKTEKVESKVRKFVSSLTQSDTPKFDIADETQLIAGLSHLAKMDEQKVSFSMGGQEVHKTAYEIITGLLSKAEPKKQFSHKPLMESGDGFSVTDDDMKGLPANVDLSSVILDKKIKKFCLDNSLDYNKADDYEKAFDAVSV